MTRPKAFLGMSGVLLGLLGYLLLAQSPLAAFQGLEVLGEEALRATLTLAFGPLASLGMAVGHDLSYLACSGWEAALSRLPFLLMPHLTLGWWWHRYRFSGGLWAVLLAALWNLGTQAPHWWLLPAMAFALTAGWLLAGALWKRPTSLEVAT